MAALIAREIAGDRRAQVIAALCTASSGFALATGHFVTTTTFDLLATTLLGWLLIRAMFGAAARRCSLAGVVVGVGFEAKPQVGVRRDRRPGRDRGDRPPLAAPDRVAGRRRPRRARPGRAVRRLAAAHGWPQLTVASNIGGSAEGGRIGFIPFQFLMVSPVPRPGLDRRASRPLRNRPCARCGSFRSATARSPLSTSLGNGKAYYLASLYPVLLGLGALPAADWTRRARARFTTSVQLAAAPSASRSAR